MSDLTLGFSPCPNDTFIFDALVNGKIDTRGLTFKVTLADVQELNEMAQQGVLDVTKLSFYTWCNISDTYNLLEAGSALGQNCGPLLIARNALTDEEVNQGTIAIPGEMTTANFLFSQRYPDAANKEPMLFSDIEGAVLSGTVDAGVIIHENRFTYQEKGLVKVIDLGEYWESKTGLPIPLGGIAVKDTLDDDTKATVQALLAESVAYAFAHPEDSKDYVKEHSQEMEDEVIKSHIDLYVNTFTQDLGEKGHQAIDKMMDFVRTMNE